MLLALASSLLIVASEATDARPEWHDVVEALATKHADVRVECVRVASITNSLAALRASRARHVAFVMRGEELDEPAVRALHRIVRNVDNDPYDDAIWGIVTGPTARDAKRMATSREPTAFTTALATTGLDLDLVPDSVTMLSDANPPGVWKTRKSERVEEHAAPGDMSHAFVFGWNDDPELILTSSHATERNLEMPFSRGNLVPTDGRFAATCKLPLTEPKREKVWIAAGNCLIANNRYSPTNMLMTALGWGKVNQFVGYTVETWFGEIGWNTWRYFHAYRMPLNLCWYAANQNLVRTMSATKDGSHERRGKEWDMDGTAFYGDPMQAVKLPPNTHPPKWTPDALPLLVVFEDDDVALRAKIGKNQNAFVADDFALITKWDE